MTAFVAVLRTTPSPQAAAVLLAAGAQAVLGWSQLLTCIQFDDVPAVLLDTFEAGLLDPTEQAGLEADLAADLAAVLGALAAVDGTLAAADGVPAAVDGGDPAAGVAAAGEAGAVIVTTRPVTDTLKLVDGDGVLTGTAERADHRLVGTPLAARLGLLRSVAGTDPDPIAVLTALIGRGTTVVGTAGWSGPAT